jgi:hypothetical protein
MKMIKFFLFIIILLIISVIQSFSQATLKIENVIVSPGEKVNVAVNATNISGMAAFQFTVVYDKAKLTFTGCSNWITGINTTPDVLIITSKSEGKITFFYNGNPVNITNGKFFDLNFSSLNNASGNTEIFWSDDPMVRELSNSIPVVISCTYTNGNVTFISTVPQSPVALEASGVSQTGFFANWKTVTGAMKYFIDVSTNNGFNSFISGFNNKDVGDISGFQLTGISAGATYYYRIRAANLAGTSNNSNVITVPLIGLGSPVVNNSTGISQTSFIINWNSLQGASGYTIDVSFTPDFISFLPGFNNKDVGNNLSYVITGLNPGNTYYYRIRGYSGTVNGANSNATKVETIPAEPVSVPASKIAQTGFIANWKASPGAVSYFIDVSTRNNFSEFVSGYNNKNVGNVTFTVVSGLNPGTDYFYRLRAGNTGGTSLSSNTTSVFSTYQANLSISESLISGNKIVVPILASNLIDLKGFQFTIQYDPLVIKYISCKNWFNGINTSDAALNINSKNNGKISVVYNGPSVNIENGKFFDIEFESVNSNFNKTTIIWSDEPTIREFSNSVPLEITCNYSNFNVSIVSIDSYSRSSTLKIYPNPSRDLVYIRDDNEILDDIFIYSSKGNLVYSKKNIAENNFKIDLIYFEAGMYLLVLRIKKINFCEKLIVEK